MKLKEEKLQEKIGFKPFKAQKEILRNQKRETVIAAGNRFGKSILCAYTAFREFLKDGKHIWIVAPTYDLSGKIFSYLTKWISSSFPKLAPLVSNRPIPQLNSPWGSWIQCKSTENLPGLLGEELDLIIIDEAARIPRKAWEEYLSARLTSRKGKAIFISTPWGKNWFYHKYLEAKQVDDGIAFNFPTIENPYFPKEEWKRNKERLPDQIFKQNFQAVFLDDAAMYFRKVKEIFRECLKDADKFHNYILGVDLGKYRDFTVLSVIDYLTHELVYWDRFKKIDWELQKARIISTARRYNNARVSIDSTGLGDPIVDGLRAEGLFVDDFSFTNKSKQQLYEKLSIFIEEKKVFIPPIEVLVDELESFTVRLSPSGKLIYGAPEGLHDDSVDSLALAVWLLSGNISVTSPIREEINKELRKKPKVYSYQ
ncbi:MAG: terminase family protein [bacterium]